MKKLLGDGHVAVWVALVLLIVFGALRYDNFVSAYNLSSFLGYNSMFVLISVGMCLVIMTGGIDLSVGTVAALASQIWGWGGGGYWPMPPVDPGPDLPPPSRPPHHVSPPRSTPPSSINGPSDTKPADAKHEGVSRPSPRS